MLIFPLIMILPIMIPGPSLAAFLISRVYGTDLAGNALQTMYSAEPGKLEVLYE